MTAERPLTSVRVLDLTQMASGPYTTMLLADAGADVIKIERPDGGDLIREFGPHVPDRFGGIVAGGFLRFGRNKRSVTLDLKHPAGKEILFELVRRSDVLVENYAPGTMASLGLAWEVLQAVNPRLVYAATSGFGQPGRLQSPHAARPAYDVVAQAMSGIMDVTGEPDGPPVRVGTIIGDLVAAVFQAYGIMLALHHRNRTDRGQMVDVAMLDAMIAMCERPILSYSLTNQIPRRGKETLVAPYGVFPCRDGWVVIAAGPRSSWLKLCAAMGRPDLAHDPRLVSPSDRSLNFEGYLKPILLEWLAQRTKDEVMAALEAEGVPAGPVLTIDEVFHSAHVAAREMLLEFDYPGLGPVRVAGNPVKLSAASPPPTQPPPKLGQHTEEVLSELLGLSPERIAELRAQRVI